MQTKYVDVNGIKTRYLEDGAGEPLVLVHGGQFGTCSSGNDWDLTIPGFAANFHVLAVDKIGCGFTENPKDPKDYLIGAGVRHLYDLIQTLKLAKVHLVGHSRGGYQVCRLALEHPEVVQTLVIVDSATLAARNGPESKYAQWDREAESMNVRDGCRHKMAMNSFSGEHLNDSYVDIMAQIVTSANYRRSVMTPEVKRVFLEDLAARREETHQWIRSGGIKMPTLVVWAFNDPTAPFDPVGKTAMDLVLGNVPRSQMVILNRAGHYCFREQPEAFAAAVTGFIKLNRR